MPVFIQKSTMEVLPNEIFLKIAFLLKPQDFGTLRIVSRSLRKKIDNLFDNFSCVILNEKCEQFFIANEKPTVLPIFTRMRIEAVSYFVDSNKRLNLQGDYFKNIVDLEIMACILQPYFLQVLNLSKHLRILRLHSAMLGGSSNIFGVHAHASYKSVHPKSLLFLRRALPKPLLEELQFCPGSKLPRTSKSKLWSQLEELHITLDYVNPSTPNFSPAMLVENLHSIQFLPTSKLATFSISVESSKDNEMFFFSMDALLRTIPVLAYPTLKSVDIRAEKCRPTSQREDYCYHKTNDYSKLQLVELTVKIASSNTKCMPKNLMAILKAQRSLKNVVVEGVKY